MWLLACSITVPTTEAQQPLAIPNSNAFVDINGDCISDLVVVSQNPETNAKTLEIWLNRKSKGFVLDTTYELPLGTGQVSFADFSTLHLIRSTVQATLNNDDL
jgi:hypothetical protein